MTKDYGDFDSASDLNRLGVFRLNIGVSRETWRALFGAEPPRAAADDDGGRGHDFAALDRLLPHPVYGRQYWVCVLNPSVETFQTAVRPLLAEAYQMAVSKGEKRLARG